MALLHYVNSHAEEYGITLSALNCDHGMRGEESERDSAFVETYCGGNHIPLTKFKAKCGQFSTESEARAWRLECYAAVIGCGGADYVATAHHANDNAETVLFNIARGSSADGACGIGDNMGLKLIRPLICCKREEIDDYISLNHIPYVTDKTNDTDDYTRNKIRHNVLPALEQAVPDAVGAIYRFSRLMQEDEEYFLRQASKLITDRKGVYGYVISPCVEGVIFKRAARIIIAQKFKRKDYTCDHLSRLFELQNCACGKRFGFLGLTAYKEEKGVAIVDAGWAESVPEQSFVCGGINDGGNGGDNANYKYGKVIACCVPQELAESKIAALNSPCKLKSLKFDLSALPDGATVRFKRAGDKFTKFGGGTKSLSDFLTDKKVPQSVRGLIPLVCVGSEVYVVGGIEISDKIKITDKTTRVGAFIACDFAAL